MTGISRHVVSALLAYECAVGNRMETGAEFASELHTLQQIESLETDTSASSAHFEDSFVPASHTFQARKDLQKNARLPTAAQISPNPTDEYLRMLESKADLEQPSPQKELDPVAQYTGIQVSPFAAIPFDLLLPVVANALSGPNVSSGASKEFSKWPWSLRGGIRSLYDKDRTPITWQKLSDKIYARIKEQRRNQQLDQKLDHAYWQKLDQKPEKDGLSYEGLVLLAARYAFEAAAETMDEGTEKAIPWKRAFKFNRKWLQFARGYGVPDTDFKELKVDQPPVKDDEQLMEELMDDVIATNAAR